MTALVTRFATIAIALTTSTYALAKQPYEGSWCEDGSQAIEIQGKTFTVVELIEGGNGECRINSATNPENNTWHFKVSCGGEASKYSFRLARGGKAVVSKFGPDFVPLNLQRCE